MANGNNSAKIHDRKSADLPINAIVADTVIDDPLEPDAKLRVLRSLRNDPLAWMHSHGQIDEAMFAAGRHWQACYELSEIGSVRAIDPTKDAVDGGRFADPFSPRRMEAAQELLAIHDDLLKHEFSEFGYSVAFAVLAEHKTFKEIAKARGMFRQAEIRMIGCSFRNALDRMAHFLGFAVGNDNTVNRYGLNEQFT